METLFAFRRREGLCAKCGAPLSEKERALEGVGGGYVRCNECVLNQVIHDHNLLVNEVDRLQNALARLVADIEANSERGAPEHAWAALEGRDPAPEAVKTTNRFYRERRA